MVLEIRERTDKQTDRQRDTRAHHNTPRAELQLVVMVREKYEQTDRQTDRQTHELTQYATSRTSSRTAGRRTETT